MHNAKSLSYRIAFCGIICALALIIMFVSIIPGMTYALPAVSGIFIWTISEQINKKWALLSFAACSFLSVMLIPEPEASAFFISFFGYYPILREVIKTLKSRLLKAIIKLTVFNVSAVITFQIISHIIGIEKMLDGIEFMGEFAVYGLWLFANIAFLCYEFCLSQLSFAYTKWLKPRFIKHIR